MAPIATQAENVTVPDSFGPLRAIGALRLP